MHTSSLEVQVILSNEHNTLSFAAYITVSSNTHVLGSTSKQHYLAAEDQRKVDIRRTGTPSLFHQRSIITDSHPSFDYTREMKEDDRLYV